MANNQLIYDLGGISSGFDTLVDSLSGDFEINLYDRMVQLSEEVQSNQGTNSLVPVPREFVPSLILQDIVSVQPMTEDHSQLFSLRYRHTSTEDKKRPEIDEYLDRIGIDDETNI